MKNWGKIFAGTRLEKQVEAAFVPVWCELITKGLRPGDGWTIVRDRIAHRAANEVVRRFLKTDCDTLFMVDSDADFGPELLGQFRDYEEGWQYDALQAFYVRRGWPPEAIWITPTGDGRYLHNIVIHPDACAPVAVIGTHCALFRREIFETMLTEHPEIDKESFDWFYYPRHGVETEDSMLSNEARRLGFKLGATTHVKAGHISKVIVAWETYQEYLAINRDAIMKQIVQTDIEVNNPLVELIAEETGETIEVVKEKILNGSKNVRQAWKNPKGAEEVRKFYGDGPHYLYDLAAWNISEYYREITDPLKEVKGKRVLIVGAGIGGEAVLMADANQVDCFELPGQLKEFGKKRLGEKVQYLDGETVMEAVHGEYDLIVMVDVVEHIHPDEFDQTMDHLANHGKDFYIHANFGQQDLYPMHYDHKKLFQAWQERFGLKQEGNYAFTREKQLSE